MITDSNYYSQKFIDYIDKIIDSNLTSNNNSFFNSDYKNSNLIEILNLLGNLEEDYPNNIIDIDYDIDFEFNSEIIEMIMKQSEITFNVGPFKFTNISKNEIIEKKCFFDKMILPDKTGTIYERFKKPLENGENQIFEEDYFNKLFLNYKNFIKFLENIRKYLIHKIENYNLYNLELVIILKIHQINEKNENLFKNICCKYSISNPTLILSDINEYEDKNILIKEKYEKFELFISDIIDMMLQNSSTSISSIDNPESIDSSLNSISSMYSLERINISTSLFINNYYHEYKIIYFISIIQTHKDSAEYIKELNNGTFISGGMDEKVIIYDRNFNQIIDLIQPNLGFFENKEEDQIIFFSQKELCIKSYTNYLSKGIKIFTDLKTINVIFLRQRLVFFVQILVLYFFLIL